EATAPTSSASCEPDPQGGPLPLRRGRRPVPQRRARVLLPGVHDPDLAARRLDGGVRAVERAGRAPCRRPAEPAVSRLPEADWRGLAPDRGDARGVGP